MANKITTSLSGGGISGQPSSYVPGPSYQVGENIGNGITVFNGMKVDSRYPTLTFKSLQAGEGINLTLSPDGNSVVVAFSDPPVPPPIFLSSDMDIAITNATVSISLQNTGVVSGTYSSPMITVDGKGRVTSIETMNSGVTAGTYTLSTIVVDAQGRVTGAENGTKVNFGVTHIEMTGSDSITVSGSPITDVGTFHVDLVDTGISAGTYTSATISVDTKGRVLSAQNGNAVSTLTVDTNDMTIMGSNITGQSNYRTATGATNIGLSNTGVAAGTYSNADIVVDAKGRIRSVQNGSNVGTVKSVGMTVGTGLNVSGSPITTSGVINLTLAQTGVSSGTYTKVAVDILGRVTNGSYLSNTDVLTALGYVPASTVAPAFTGAATGATAASGDNTIKLATTAFVQREVAAAVANAISQIRLQLAAQGITI